MKTKDQLYDVESWLYDKYGSIGEILDEIETYFDEDGNYDRFIDDVLSYYDRGFDGTDVVQIYRDLDSIPELEYYSEYPSGTTYLELSDVPILDYINADIDEYTYWQLADEFLERFEKEYNISNVGYIGRSNRHVVCDDSWENVYRYGELVDGMAKYQDEFVDYINSNYGKQRE